MAPTRTSSRQAAQKAKEAIAAAPDTKPRGGAGTKRKESSDKGPEPKKEKKNDQKPAQEDVVEQTHASESLKQAEENKPASEHDKHKQPKAEEPKSEQEEDRSRQESPEKSPEANSEHTKPSESAEPDQKPASGHEVENGVKKSPKREDIVTSNILEKGIIYFFYRPRVNTSKPHSINDIARSFIVLRPTPLGATLGEEQGTVEAGSKCRLLALPKKKFPTSGNEKDMAFVEKAGQSVKALHDSFMAGGKYETATQGERSIEEARPFAEGVYAITSEKRASHLAYILTIPDKIGTLQEDFGLYGRGSWIVQSKNPKQPGPSYAALPEGPEYPEQILEKFGDYRWRPLEPDFIDYPNAQILMIGDSTNDLGKATTADPADKKDGEEQPGEELEKFEHENEERVESLRDDDTMYEDLGLDAKKYPKVPTTWPTS
ncbi:uncharacterized protein KD926_007938 [Aspergillus affinis]|uniref:uncharacterized protein n=1 Tax=Aspergillus affinis TaxID=1070780 RepID=UPI0022FEC764|nr:uncharacterized protein KD926_007938 [Aspergillus affinis]KAI9045522.1 hypothetical protein KD926_007938 [Aspergillus affinis]